MNELTQSLYKVMKHETYKGVKLINVLGRWMYGLKSFETKEELKMFIDTLYPNRKP